MESGTLGNLQTTPRVRFAPSPTGYLHVGGARTALFNWLYARRHGGRFILRVEDTDAERSSWDMVGGILEGLRWLGLDWDEGPDVGGPHAPYFQSERLNRHRAVADRLVASGSAYYCYCSPELLKQKRADAEAAGLSWRYDRTCACLSEADRTEHERKGTPRAVRFKIPPGRTRVDDLVHGAIEFDHANLEDFVLLRSDRQPTYQLSVVADDIDMGMTHVIRGDDHLSNTPKQVLLYQALGARSPQFAHVPLILGPDKKRLSKRHGATSVTEYERTGYLPEAMINFLALLGWSPGTDEEIFTRDELVARFSLDQISRGNAVFNVEKLDWFNAQHIGRLAPDDLLSLVEGTLQERGHWDERFLTDRKEWLFRAIDLLKPRARKLADLVDELSIFLGDTIQYDPAAVEKYLRVPELPSHVEALGQAVEGASSFDKARLEEVLRSVATTQGVKAAVLIHATRIALTGKSVGPGVFEVMELFGRERTVARLRSLQKML